MNAIPILKASLFRVFFLFVLGLCITSCRKINPIESSLKNQAFVITEREETEALFFISTANATKSIISKSEIAQEKSSDAIVQELGKRIEFQENQILNDISKMATMKLIVINEINATHKRDLYNLIDAKGTDFNDVYLDAMKEALNDQIELFETISRETNDKQILEMVLRYLPEQYKLLRETERIRKQNV
jgi:predicted outer membrane protein